MALTRRYLKEIGIESEKIDLIIEAHTDVTDALKSERDALKADADEIKRLRAENEELKKQTVTDSEWKSKYEAKEAELVKFKTEQEAEKTLQAKRDAYLELLKETKVNEKAHKKALKLADLDSLELVDGKIKDADKVAESIKADWADFIVSEDTQGAKTDNPSGNKTVSTYTREDIAKMSAEEINANWEQIKKSL